MARVLVIGQRGQVATALAGADARDLELAFAGRDRCDLLRPASIEAALAAHQPSLVINTAAYTAVDRAETESQAAFALNRDAAGELARACEKRGAALLHLSTDYVFDGAKGAPYVEDDPTNPLNIYGLSKAAGEAVVLASGARACILRTSWVFSAHGANFFTTMQRLSANSEVRVVADQIGAPTYAPDLADACLIVAQALLDDAPAARGVLHFANQGQASWASFAEAIFASILTTRTQVRPLTTTEYGAPARRPADSRLDCARIRAALGVIPRDWRAALDACLAARAQ